MVFAALVIAAPAEAQRQVPVQLVQVATEGDDPDRQLAISGMSQPWFDSLSAYFSAELRDRGPRNAVRIHSPAFDGYRIRVMSLPILLESGQPSGATMYSAIVFRPPSIGVEWRYVTSFIGYHRHPRQAARAIVDFFSNAVAVRD